MKYMRKKQMRRIISCVGELIKNYRIQAILTLLGILFIVVGYFYYYRYFNLIRDPRKLKDIITGYGNYSVVVLVGLQIIQVIMFFIPGGFVQIAGGYIYGVIWGTIISMIGIVIGSIIVFLVANRLGKPFIETIVSEKDIKFFRRLLQIGHDESKENKNKNRSLLIIFLLYLIPGLPKDVLGYICGITDISLVDFIIYSTAGRIPGVIISSYFGSEMQNGNKFVLIIVSVVVCGIFVAGILKGERIIKTIIKKNK